MQDGAIFVRQALLEEQRWMRRAALEERAAGDAVTVPMGFVICEQAKAMLGVFSGIRQRNTSQS